MADRIDVDVIVEAIAKGFDQVSRDMKGVGDASEDAGDQVEKSSGRMDAMNVALGNMAAQGLMSAGKALFDFAKGSIAVASDVEEMSSKFNAVFKDLSQTTEAELANMADC